MLLVTVLGEFPVAGKVPVWSSEIKSNMLSKLHALVSFTTLLLPRPELSALYTILCRLLCSTLGGVGLVGVWLITTCVCCCGCDLLFDRLWRWGQILEAVSGALSALLLFLGLMPTGLSRLNLQ